MIKAFLFDYGGVITASGGRDELPLRLAERLRISYDEAAALLLPVWGKFSQAKITEEQVWSSMEEQYGKPITPAQRDIWNTWDVMRPLPEMLEVLKDLKDRGYVVGLLSNTITDTAKEIRDHGGYDSFDFLVLSCEVGYAKPAPEIYDLAMQKLPRIKPAEVVFLDDQERCLVPARQLGMQTILVTDIAQAISVIHRRYLLSA